MLLMATNGPEIKGSCGPAFCQKAGWRIFCHPGTEFYGLYECRQSCQGVSQLSGSDKFIAGSGAVRVCQVVLSCLGCRSKCKKCDDLSRFFDKKSGKQLTFSTYEKSIVSRTISIVLVNYCS